MPVERNQQRSRISKAFSVEGRCVFWKNRVIKFRSLFVHFQIMKKILNWQSWPLRGYRSRAEVGSIKSSGKGTLLSPKVGESYFKVTHLVF